MIPIRSPVIQHQHGDIIELFGLTHKGIHVLLHQFQGLPGPCLRLLV